MKTGSGQSAAGNGFEVALIAGCGVVFGFGTIVFVGGWRATRFTGGAVSADLSTWWPALVGLVTHPGDPAAAWGVHGHGVPGPGLYWVCTAVAAVVLGSAVGLAVWGWRRLADPSRVRFGVDTDARQAAPHDVKTLAVRSALPPTGRLLLGVMAPKGPLLATEDRDRHQMSGRAGRRQGSRGSVALIGPTQAGKTALLSAGMIGWDGPVIALSVKRDLYDVTASPRADRGELAVFDPGASTGLATARWTPLRGVATASGALRAGRSLAAAIPRNGVSGSDYWAQQGETFVSAYMALAGLSVRLDRHPDGTRREPLTIQMLTAWVFRGVGITDPTVNELVRSGLESDDLETQLLAEAAALKLTALHNEDARLRSSTYATARMAFEAWAEPSVAHSASTDPRDAYNSDVLWDRRPRFLDLDWLMGDSGDGRANTLYLIAPDTEFKRLAPVLGGLLGDFREQLHAWDIEGRRLTKPLLIVIDEAAQLELQWLPEEVSTIAGLGGMFVTCWQSKAQIDHRYGTLADAVLGGHRSKVVFTGCDDPATLNWLGKVAGTEHVARRSWSAETTGGRRTVSESTQREDLVAPHVVRQMLPGEAVLIHGTLPPVHLRSVRWWEDKTLRAMVPTDDHGKPVRPDTSTCPLTDEAPAPGDAGLDRAAHDDSTRHLPPSSTPRPKSDPPPPAKPPARRAAGPTGQRQSDTRSGGTDTATVSAGQLTLDVDPVAEPNRYAGSCHGCGEWVAPGDGAVVTFGSGNVIVCPPCATTIST
jgi:type IV secretion system protein VirD4